MAKLFIRGVGANTSTTGSETGVAMHVDGAFVARAEAQLASIFDLERVEVLRGPQGTLYGRNAVGGSVNLITAKPTQDVEGYFRGTIGDYEMLNLEGAISGPITEQILGRVAFRSESRAGFGVNPVTGNDVDDLNRQMARGHLLFQPSDRFDVLLTGEYYTQDDASRALKFRATSYPGVARLFSPGVGGYASDPRDLASEVDAATETEVWAATATSRLHLGENATLSNITSWRRIEGFITQDLDVSAVVSSAATNAFNTTVQRRDIESEQFSSEFQFTYEGESIDLVLGAFYFNEQQRPVDTVGLGPVLGQSFLLGRMAAPGAVIIDGAAQVPPQPVSLDLALALCNTAEFLGGGISGAPTPPKRVCIKSDLQSDSWAVFGQTVIDLGVIGLDQLSIKLGGRFSSEDVFASNPSIIFAGANNAAAVTAPILIGTPDGSASEREFEAFTPEIGLEWRPSEDVLIYYTYSEGFKAGAGENAAPGAASAFRSIIVDPEEIESHELGLRSSWADGRVVLNAAVFNYELAGQQINKTVGGGPAGFSTIFENAALTEADGVDVELTVTPTDSFRLFGTVSWLDSRYVDFLTKDPLDPRNVAGGVAAGDPLTDFNPALPEIQLAGNRTRNSPEWSANLHAELDLPGMSLPSDGLITLMTDVTYRDDIFFTEFERLLEGQEAYTLWDANIRYASGGERFTANFWVKNITDELVAGSTFALATARTLGVTYLPPRTFGLTLGYRY
jgi:iron complex outermembrane receptor protein